MTSVLLEMERLRIPRSGLGQFCLQLGGELVAQRPDALELACYVPRPQVGVFGDAVRYVVHSPLHRLVGPPRERCDVWHAIHQDSRYLPRSRSTRLLVTLHDLNFLEKYSGVRRAARLRALQRQVDRADAIAFISGYTEATARAHLRIEGKPARVVYNGNTLRPVPGARRPAFAPAGPFLFAIGIIGPKKNFHVLVPFLRALGGDRVLVIAGDASGPYARSIVDLARAEGVSERVLLPGAVTDEEKAWLYANAEAFLFPSLAEGFGAPVVDAMVSGKPVFLSTRTCLPEIGGPEAYFWPDFAPAAMREVFERGMAECRADAGKPDRLRAWASRFSYARAAREYLAMYEELAASLTRPSARAAAASRT